MEVNHKYVIERMPTYIHVEFDQPHRVLSSAVLNGGLVRAKHIVKLNVEENFVGRKGPFEPPDVTLCDYCQRMGWEGLARSCAIPWIESVESAKPYRDHRNHGAL